MKTFVVIAFVAIIGLACARPNNEKFTEQYDDLDLQEILRSERLFLNYFNCLVGKGKCTPDGQLLKDAIPDALSNECAKCSEKQKNGSRIVLRHLIENREPEFKELEAIFDKDHIYRKKYRAEAEKEGIKLKDE